MVGRISLRVKLLLAFTFIGSLAGLGSYLNVGTITSLDKHFTHIVTIETPRARMLQDMRLLLDDIKNEVLIYRLGDRSGYDAEDRAKHTATLKTYLIDLSSWDERHADLLKADKDDVRLAAEMKSISEDRTKVVVAVRELMRLKEENASEAVIKAKYDEFTKIQLATNDSIYTVMQRQLNSIDSQDKLITNQVSQLNKTLFITSGLAAIVALFMGLLISIIITRNLRKIKNGAAHIAAGDFNYKINIASRDEIGRLADTFNQMSERLKESYRRLALEKRRDETLLESIGEGLVAVDAQGQIVLINKSAGDLMDIAERYQTMGKPIYGTFEMHNEQWRILKAEETPIYQTLQTGEMASSLIGRMMKDGSKVTINLTAYPIILDGRVEGAIVVMRDVTKEKEIDRMKTEFISLASHQLRTPLSAIKWFSEMLIAGDAGQLNADQNEFAHNVYDSTQRMIELVNSLLNISRIESGRIIIDPKPTDLSTLVGGIVTDLRAKTEERQQTLIISVHKDIPKINLDARLIGQVYLNLLTNAIKYTPKGGEISVFISIKDGQVVSQVSDNGYGIPKDQQGKMFQKFFRADNVVKVETDGTGLGMYLVKAIIDSSGGKIWFESKENVGTSFWFTLPLTGMKAKEGEVTLDV